MTECVVRVVKDDDQNGFCRGRHDRAGGWGVTRMLLHNASLQKKVRKVRFISRDVLSEASGGVDAWVALLWGFMGGNLAAHFRRNVPACLWWIARSEDDEVPPRCL